VSFTDLFYTILRGAWTLLLWTWWIIIPVLIYYSWRNNRKAHYVDDIKYLVLSVKVPKNNDKGPIAAEMMFASLHGILQPKTLRDSGAVVQEHLSFEIVARTNVIEFFVRVPEKLKDFVEGQIYAQYPTAEISTVKDYSLNLDIDDDKVDECTAGTELSLVKDNIFPIKTFQNFDVDPLAGITGMLSKLDGENERVWIQILAEPVDDDWSETGLNYVNAKKGGNVEKPISMKDIGKSALKLVPEMIALAVTPPDPKKKKDEKKEEKAKLSHAEEVELAAIEEKANKLGFKVLIRVVYLADTTAKARERIQAVVGAFKQFNSTNLNGFKSGEIYTGKEFLNAYRARLLDSGFILNIEEIASLYHLPHVSVETPNIVWTSSKKGEPPANLPYMDNPEASADDLTPIGMTTFRGSLKTFGIKKDDRRRHMYVIGKSGTGKSRFLENLAIADIEKGEGVAVVDPHGELIDRILRYIPKSRIDDVVYFNPADRDFPIAFNPLEATPEFREEVANGFVSVLKKLFGYSWGPRLEYVLKHTVMALIEVEGSTMLGIVRMLTDKNYRRKIVSQVNDPVVQMFWLKEFAAYNDRMETETISPILNKVGQFTASPIIRNIVGQPKSRLDFAKIMNEQKILLVDLSSGKIGEANSALLGSMIITKLQLAAMSRAYIPEEERKDFFLYVDEFQNFATDSFATILSEARKYRLSLTVANQYITQMEETVRDAVFGNVGTLISFRVGASDAAYLEKEYAPVFEQNDLVNLDNRHVYLNMLIDGVSSIPFSAMTIDSPQIKEDLTVAIAAVSRQKYGSPKDAVEEQIRDWYNVDAVVAGVTGNERIVVPAVRESIEGGRESGAKREKADKIINNNSPRKELERAIRERNERENKENNRNNSHNQKVNNSGRGAATKSEPIYKKIDKDTLRQIIREATMPKSPHPKPEPEKTDKPDSVQPETKPEPPKEKDRIVPQVKINDRKEIHHQVKTDDRREVHPIEEQPKHQSAEREQLRESPKVIHPPKREEPPKNQTPIPPAEKKESASTQHRHEHKKISADTPYRDDKVVKEISPEDFHQIKTIHPHEKIQIKSEPREIRPGETVDFK
jgi:hypothetical protein